MPVRIHQLTCPDAPDFIDGIAKLETAILDMDRRRTMGQEPSVYIGKTRHWLTF